MEPSVELDQGVRPGPRPRRFWLRTFGCQMNVHDSEKVENLLLHHGYGAARRPEDADLLIVNTCSIREKAEHRLYSDLGLLRAWKAALPGRGKVVLTVTQRPSGRDTVAISAGFPYRKDATVTLQVDTTGLDFYTSQSSAFARDGKAAVAAFQRGQEAQARSPGPRDGQVIVDTFSLRGFSAAYAAINKACPAR